MSMWDSTQADESRGWPTATEAAGYVVTFDPRPIPGPGAIDGLRHMPLPDARALRDQAARIPKRGRIVNTLTLEVIATGPDAIFYYGPDAVGG